MAHPRYRTPHRATIVVGLLTAALAGFLPLQELSELVNIGVLTAFVIVCSSVVILRYRSPEIERTFRTPLVPFVPLVGIGFSLVLIASLPPATWVRFAIWMAVGFLVYFAYSRRNSRLAREEEETAVEGAGRS